MLSYVKSRFPFIAAFLFLPTLLMFPANSFSQEKGNFTVGTYLEALRNYNSGNFEAADKLFREVTTADKENDASFFYLANIQLEWGNIDKATEYLTQAIKRDPGNSWYKQYLARLYTYSGKNDKAIKLYNELREEFPYKSELYDGLIELHIQAKDYSKAREVLEDIEKSVGVNEATGLTRFNLLIYENMSDSAYNYLIALDKEFATPRTSAILGDYHASLQNDTIAEQYYIKALNMAPDYVPASFGLAEIYRIQGKFDLYFGRIYPFMANPVVEPFMKTNYMNQLMGNTRFVQTFLPQVDSMMTFMYNAHPQDSTVAYSYSLFLVQSGKGTQAIDVLEKNVNQYPGDKEAHRQYLSLIYYLEMWEQLIQNSEKALIHFKDDTDFLQFRGIAELQSGIVDKSIITFKEILRYTKDSATTVNTLTTIGDLSYRAGNKKEAFKYYRRTLKKEPKHLPALNNYAYYMALDGKNLKEAYRMSKITVEQEPNNSTYLDTYAWILHLMGNNLEAKGVFKQAMLYGGKESADILDHYAHVLYELKEYDIAFLYWDQADKIDPSLGIAQKAAALKEKTNKPTQ
ncbi:Beta-barrel assembly-enhancing protease [bioreactor metagenome]|uniref:Beta-barrel assembly-enhancing protease n=1 Tax=bioreactor metagenome TaxID=1076179 RepID=A0A645B0Z5_9ZZZZ|nr:tetratricopeptide repeat protein [Rikenellaceae bacterium]